MDKHKTATFSERHPIFIEAYRSAWHFSKTQLFVPLGLSLLALLFDYFRMRQFMGFLKSLLAVLVSYAGMMFLVLLYNFIKAPFSILAKHHFKLIEIESRLAAAPPSADHEEESEELESSAAAELKVEDCQIWDCFKSENNTISKYQDIGYETPVRLAIARFRFVPTEGCPESINVRGQIEILNSNSTCAKSIFDGVWLSRVTGKHMRFFRSDIHEFILALVERNRLISYEHETQPGEDGMGSFLYPELNEIPGKSFTLKVNLLAEAYTWNKGQRTFSFDITTGKKPTVVLSPKNDT